MAKQVRDRDPPHRARAAPLPALRYLRVL